jgi:hypothetical protein
MYCQVMARVIGPQRRENMFRDAEMLSFMDAKVPVTVQPESFSALLLKPDAW